MPDSFGNPTPQEVQQQILQQQQAGLQNAFASNPSGFGKVGVGLGNALGGLFRRGKEPQDPLAEVRAGLQEAESLMGLVSAQLGPELGEFVGRNRAADTMVRNGMPKEAQQQRQLATEVLQARKVRLDGIEAAKVDLAVKKAPKLETHRDGDFYVTNERSYSGEVLGEVGRSSIDRVQETRDVTGLTDTQLGKDIVEFTELGTQAIVAYTKGADLLNIAAETPELLGTTGALANFGNNALILTKNAGKFIGMEGAENEYKESGFDFSSFNEGMMKEVAVENSKFRSGILGIAVSLVAAEQGRISNEDVQLKLEELGGKSGDIDAFSGAIRSSIGGLNTRLEAFVSVRPDFPQRNKEAVFDALQGPKALFESAGRANITWGGFTEADLAHMSEEDRSFVKQKFGED
jgi:hypothetical protein